MRVITIRRIEFTVYGEPVPKGRHRRAYNKKTGKVFEHPDPKTVIAENDFLLQSLKTKPDKPIDGYIRLSLTVIRSPLKSFRKWEKEIINSGGLLPNIKRPDLDNYFKLVKDAMNGVYWLDDSQVVLYKDSGKWYGNPPRTEVIVEEVRFEYT